MRVWSIGLVCLLAACGAEAPADQVAAASEVAIEETAPDAMPVMGPERVILAFGDSLFAGYNLDEHEGYPERLEALLRVRGVNAKVIDAGVSGDTTAAGLNRIAFVLDNSELAPELAIVELGGNDLLRGISPEQTRANLEGILQELRDREIPVLLMGMRAPPNLGVEYQGIFDGLYPELADRYGAALVPFFMEPVFDQPQLIQGDRIHPTAAGIEAMVAANVDAVIAALPEGDAR